MTPIAEKRAIFKKVNELFSEMSAVVIDEAYLEKLKELTDVDYLARFQVDPAPRENYVRSDAPDVIHVTNWSGESTRIERRGMGG